MKQILLIFLPILALAGCASTSNPPGPEGTGDHKQGYYLGRSDAAKQQYWMTQNLQKQPKEPAIQATYIPVTVGGAQANGVTTVPHTELIRVNQ
jgi:uncharacterized protein YceK